MAMSVPSLKRICVLKVVEEIRNFCPGVAFEDLGKYYYIVGPLEYLSSPCIELIFQYVTSTRQLNPPWLSVLLVTHLRGVDLSEYPSAASASLFKILLRRCKRLERLIIPNCKKVPNKTLCEVLMQNPSLLRLDISNKLSPKVDASVVDTIAHSCRHLRVLKLSDYRVDDPKSLLVLCGKVVARTSDLDEAERGEQSVAVCSQPQLLVHQGQSQLAISPQVAPSCVDEFYRSEPRCREHLVAAGSLELSSFGERMELSPAAAAGRSTAPGNEGSSDPVEMVTEWRNDIDRDHREGGVCSNGRPSNDSEEEEEGANARPYSSGKLPSLARAGGGGGGAHKTREEQENEQKGDNDVQEEEEEEEAASGSDDDLYERDEPISPMDVEDHGSGIGCLELETLWLDYVNLNDQVAAVLMQNLPRLKDLNVCDTDICNPWRLLDQSQSHHLKYLESLDIRSTALSRTALQLIPKFHPDLQQLSISSTMLPPPTYAHIGRLTGVADLELIGGQFYPSPPEEIFQQGIAPAVHAIGKHLHSLNLTYFAHVEFEVIALSCPKIEHLDLSYTSVFVTYPCVSLGDCCPRLTSLNLNFCHTVAREENHEGNHDLPGAAVPEDTAIEKMIGQPPNIEELQLGGLGICDDTVKGIFPGVLHPLRVLNVSRCKLLTITGMEHVWDRCPFMQTIDMMHCKAITLADFQRFEKKCFEQRPRFKVEGRLLWK